MRCEKCQHQLNPGAKFCGNCGYPVPVQPVVGQANQTIPGQPVVGQSNQTIPGQPNQPYPQAPKDPGELFGILSVVLAFTFAPLGLIFGFIGKNKSKQAGYTGTLSKVGIWVNTIFIALFLAFMGYAISLGSNDEYNSGTYDDYNCQNNYNCPQGDGSFGND
jgi:zinc-ribbon domain